MLGNYQVLVDTFPKITPETDSESFQNQLNAKFNNLSTTPLILDVEEGKNSFRFDLKSDETGTGKAL